MDIVTQGLLGSVVAQSAATRQELRRAAAIGFCAGLLPDADALLRSDSDPLMFLEFHRQFTHSLVFIPLGALLAAGLLWPLFRRVLPFGRIYRYSFLGYALSGLLDACTSYGTQLWWPFSDERVAWSIISIVDPIFSVALLVGVGFAIRRRCAIPARIAAAFCAAYMVLALVQHERALSAASALAAKRGDVPAIALVKPSFANLLLWRSVYTVESPDETRVQVDGIRVSVAGSTKVYPGENFTLVTAANLSTWSRGNRVAQNDFERFARFSHQLIVRHPEHPDLLGDARFAILPTSLESLWGIEAPRSGQGHARFVTNRSVTPAIRERFTSMLLGRE